MARVLVVEDDRAVAGLVELYLRHAGHEVETLGDGATALRRVEAATTGGGSGASSARGAADAAPPMPDLIVLDLMLPGLDGRGVCRRIRAVSAVPIVMLTALDDDRDAVAGLDLGADDYLTKPFNPDELVARVRAVLRRTARAEGPSRGAGAVATAASSAVTALGAARLDRAARRLTVGEREVALRAKEFDLLAVLAERPGHVLTRGQLLDRVWGEMAAVEPGTRTVDVHVSRLRERLTAAGAGLAVETVRSVGYRLAVTKGGGDGACP